MKKLFGGGIIAIIMMLVVIPCVSAAESDWKVTDITSDDTLIEKSTTGSELVSNTNETTITYSAGRFKLVGQTGTGKGNSDLGNENIGADATSENRPSGYAWVGFEITREGEGLESKQLSVKFPGESDFKTIETGKMTFKDYVGISKDKLEKALKNKQDITYTYVFKLADEEETYIVNIIIKPAGIILYKETTNPSELKEDDILFDGPVEEQKLLDAEKSSQASSSSEEQKSTTDAKNPNTADTIIYSVIAVIISALGLTFVYKKLHN